MEIEIGDKVTLMTQIDAYDFGSVFVGDIKTSMFKCFGNEVLVSSIDKEWFYVKEDEGINKYRLIWIEGMMPY
jgi:hypothetical protein